MSGSLMGAAERVKHGLQVAEFGRFVTVSTFVRLLGLTISSPFVRSEFKPSA